MIECILDLSDRIIAGPIFISLVIILIISISIFNLPLGIFLPLALTPAETKVNKLYFDLGKLFNAGLTQENSDCI